MPRCLGNVAIFHDCGCLVCVVLEQVAAEVKRRQGGKRQFGIAWPSNAINTYSSTENGCIDPCPDLEGPSLLQSKVWVGEYWSLRTLVSSSFNRSDRCIIR
jgi:hypothetical protein